MNPARLLEHFDRIAEAPDAVPRLRRFILDLAVRGKLVEQDPNDEPAADLKLFKDEEGIATSIPSGWGIGVCGDILNMQYGKGLVAKDRKDQGEVPVFGSNGVVGYTDTPLTTTSAIIIGRKGSAGALNLCDGPSWTTDVAYYLVPPTFFDIRFLYFTLQTFDLGSLGKGVKPGLSRSDVYNMPVIVPPLAEQHRIVAKVDELMALCDRLEAIQVKRKSRRDRLASASLKRISQPEGGGNGEEFRENVRFHLNHLPRLTTRLEHIKELRQTILNLAVRGKLVPQGEEQLRADDIAARVRLERKREKAHSLSPGENAKARINFSETWPLPHSWAMLSLSELALQIVDCPHSTPIWAEYGKMCVRTSQFNPGYLSLSSSRFVSEETFAVRIQRLKPCENDILYSREGGILGVACRVPPGVELCLGQRMMLIRSSSVCRPEFLELVLNSPLITGLAKAQITGGAAPRINVSTVKSYPIPLPPLAEQSRILDKVHELMALCDQLEAQITTAQADRSRLLEATLCEALGAGNMPTPRAGRTISSRATPVARQAEKPLQAAKPRLVEPAHTAPQRNVADQPRPAPDSRPQSAPEAILAQMRPGHDYSRAQLCDALGLSVYEWNMAIRALKENGQVIQTGEKRGARYHVSL